MRNSANPQIQPRPLYTPAEQARRDASPWTLVQGILAPLQFVVFLISLWLVLRYLLETCGDVAAASAALRRIPVHVGYNITLVDRGGDHAVAMISPDRAPVIDQARVSTNHQGAIDWPRYARLIETEQRHAYLTDVLSDSNETLDHLTDRFLAPPLYRTTYAQGCGTLYTAVYLPGSGEARFLWPGVAWRQGFDGFEEGVKKITYSEITPETGDRQQGHG